MILGDDLNSYLNIDLDKQGKKDILSKYTLLLKSICEEYNLIDIWRIGDPTCTIFTHREKYKVRNCPVTIRLYFLISEGISYAVKNTASILVIA